jgi:hypothetical protein
MKLLGWVLAACLLSVVAGAQSLTITPPSGFTGGADTAALLRVADAVTSGVMPAQVTVPVAKPSDSILWSYTDADVASFQITEFVICLDAQPCVHLPPATNKSTTAEIYAWKLPALTVGAHTAKLQACNADMCSSSVAFDFKLQITPNPPINIRIGSSGKP